MDGRGVLLESWVKWLEGGGKRGRLSQRGGWGDKSLRLSIALLRLRWGSSCIDKRLNYRLNLLLIWPLPKTKAACKLLYTLRWILNRGIILWATYLMMWVTNIVMSRPIWRSGRGHWRLFYYIFRAWSFIWRWSSIKARSSISFFTWQLKTLWLLFFSLLRNGKGATLTASIPV